MKTEQLRAREMVADRARRELDKLRNLGDPLRPDELHAIADHIEWAISVLQSTEPTVPSA